MSVTCVVFAVAVWISNSKWWNGGVRPRPFESAAWKQFQPVSGDTVRSEMIASLLRTYDFQGWTREEVIELLGEPQDHYAARGWDLAYYIGLERHGWFSLDDELLVFRLGPDGRVVEWKVIVT
jgi:hypothetical protein